MWSLWILSANIFHINIHKQVQKIWLWRFSSYFDEIHNFVNIFYAAWIWVVVKCWNSQDTVLDPCSTAPENFVEIHGNILKYCKIYTQVLLFLSKHSILKELRRVLWTFKQTLKKWGDNMLPYLTPFVTRNLFDILLTHLIWLDCFLYQSTRICNK